jgi:nicotinamidase-related amidase
VHGKWSADALDQMRKSKKIRPALLMVDWMNPMDFPGARPLGRHALQAARPAATLLGRARATGIPVVYANDNFGQWRSDFRAVVEECASGKPVSRELARMLAPSARDYFVLKPRHSAFFETPLQFLLGQLAINALVITGIAADSCILATALDAAIRGYRLWIPANCVASQTLERTRTALRAVQQFDADADLRRAPRA